MWMIQTALPQEVPEKIHQLLEKYHNAEKITLYDIAKFHAQFENIHHFRMEMGELGRMIILKQCLDHNIVPVIIRDIHKAEYNRYLNKAQHEQDYKGLEAYFENAKREYYKDINAKQKEKQDKVVNKYKQAKKMPRADKLSGGGDTSGKSDVDIAIEMMNNRPWEKIPEKYQKILLGE